MACFFNSDSTIDCIAPFIPCFLYFKMAPQISEKELDEIYAFAVQLGKDAGKMLMDAAKVRMSSGGAAHESVEKENAVDIVTKTDTGDLDTLTSPFFVYNWLTRCV